jgi:hypothetical protein
MHYVVAKCYTPHNLLALEPVLEGLYYKHAPCKLVLHTSDLFKELFRHHPLISQITDNPIFPADALVGHYDFDQEKLQFNFHERSTLLDTLANFADVKLLRRTPSFGKYDWKKIPDVSDVLYHCVQKLPDTLKNHYGDNLGESYAIEDLLANLDRIVSCEVFVGGPGSLGPQIAYAAGVKTVIELYDDYNSSHQQAYPEMQLFKTDQSHAVEQALRTALKESKYPAVLNRGNACEGIKNYALKFCRGRGLDVGSNQWPLPGALPSDENSRRFHEGPFDFIFSSHCLEHIEDWQSELKLWDESLISGGTFFIYLPHPAMEPWRPGGAWVGAHHKWGPEPVSLVKWLHENTRIKVSEYSVYPDYYYSFFIRGQKV